MNSTTLTRSTLESPSAAPAAPPRGAGRAQRLWRGSPDGPGLGPPRPHRPARRDGGVLPLQPDRERLGELVLLRRRAGRVRRAGRPSSSAPPTPANSITVDKPPASLWIMALSVKVFGLSSFAILLPQVVMGVASVGVLYATVKKNFGAQAGLIAGAVLALTPVAVLMFRFNNPDALLTFLMVLAAWATHEVDREDLAEVVHDRRRLHRPGLPHQDPPGVPRRAGRSRWPTSSPPGPRCRSGSGTSSSAASPIVLSAGWWVAVVELLPGEHAALHRRLARTTRSSS